MVDLRMALVLQVDLSSKEVATVRQVHILSAIPRPRDPLELPILGRPFHRTK